MTSLFMLYAGAIVLGAFHAFEPGHGKTLIAAYMVGTKGRAWDGVLLGTIVTITHIFSVILLGIVALLLSKTYSDEVLHNWLGLVSAGLILAVGIWMLRQRLSGSGHHHHSHDGHSHEHQHPHEHAHVHKHAEPPAAAHKHSHHHQEKKAHSKWELLLGISGGLIPCPAAIVTLLAAIAAGKLAQGLSVTLFFSLGRGDITIGVLLSQSRHLTSKISDNMEFARRMSIASAVLIIALGSYTMFASVKSILS